MIGLMLYLNVSLTGEYYAVLFHDHMHLFREFGFPNNYKLFHWDSVLYNSAQTVLNWFEDHTGDFQQLMWLSYSPSISLINHVGHDEEEVCSYTRSLPYKYQVAEDSYWDNTSQHFFNSFWQPREFVIFELLHLTMIKVILDTPISCILSC